MAAAKRVILFLMLLSPCIWVLDGILFAILHLIGGEAIFWSIYLRMYGGKG